MHTCLYIFINSELLFLFKQSSFIIQQQLLKKVTVYKVTMAALLECVSWQKAIW